jgi:hypothetical protein
MMKKILLLISILFIFGSSHLKGENNIYLVAGDTVPMFLYTNYVVDVLVENDVTITGLTMGLQMETTGGIAARFKGTGSGYQIGNDGLTWNFSPVGSEPYDTLYVTAWTEIGQNGIPPGPSKEMFGMDIYIEECPESPGSICIDSCTIIDSEESWYWVNENQESVFPSFNSGNGQICQEVVELFCGYSHFTVTPENDTIVADHCVGAEFQFLAYLWRRDYL